MPSRAAGGKRRARGSSPSPVSPAFTPDAVRALARARGLAIPEARLAVVAEAYTQLVQRFYASLPEDLGQALPWDLGAVPDR